MFLALLVWVPKMRVVNALVGEAEAREKNKKSVYNGTFYSTSKIVRGLKLKKKTMRKVFSKK